MKKGINWRKVVVAISTLGLFASLAACNNASFTANKKGQRDQGVADGFPTSGLPTTSSVPGTFDGGNGGCSFDISRISDCFTNSGVQGVNVWVVVDTSSSFTMRERVGRELSKNFSNGLRNNLPLTISVIASHTRTSPFGAFNYDVFYRDSDKDRFADNGNRNYVEVRSADSEPATIRVNSNSDFDTADDYLQEKLATNMISDPLGANSVGESENESLSGVNELGLLNLAAAMQRVSVGDQSRQSNYGWLVVFLADENDVCVKDPTMHLKPNERDMYDTECADGINGTRITPSYVYNLMRSFAGSRPMIVSGVLNVPGKSVWGDPGNSGVGYGYIELIQMAQGQVKNF